MTALQAIIKTATCETSGELTNHTPWGYVSLLQHLDKHEKNSLLTIVCADSPQRELFRTPTHT